MTISIITATFNSSATLEHTLASVASQDYPDIEHLIIDGGSSDHTLEIASGFPHVSRVLSEKDTGIYDAMNKGVSLASGEIIGILNSDDFYPAPDILSNIAAVFKEKNCDALYGDLQYVSSNDVSRVVRHWRAGSYRPNAFKWGWMPPHPTFFVKRDIYQELGAFKLDMGTAADYELMLRYIHCHGIPLAYLPRILVKMRTGGASNESLSKRLKANAMDRMAWKVNGVSPNWFTLYVKPLRKITQYLSIP